MMAVIVLPNSCPVLTPCARAALSASFAAQTLDTGSFRCPICRETIHMPQGGVTAFPPSFIVNQLLDLMAQQRRDVIPKCSVHTNQELLFCETCDIVFCSVCVDCGSHSGRGASEHTVIPFAIAIKRMSEILLFKAHLCIKNLNAAYEAVSDELRQLELSVDKTLDSVNRSFQDVMAVVDRRRHECLQWVRKIREEKKNILKEQLDLIQAEKDKVQGECDGLQYQVEVRNITKKISDLNEKLDTTSTLSEPRENSFLKYEYKHNDALREIAKAIANFGHISVSTTFPALSTAKIFPTTAHLRSSVRITTVDYHGNPRISGGDPIVVDLRTEKGDVVETKIKDNEDGTYDILYLPQKSGKLKLCVSIFSRPIKDSPFSIEVSEHINPVAKFGSRGSGLDHFCQPVRVCINADDVIYVLDTGNSRIKVLSAEGQVLKVLGSAGVENQSATGMAMTPDGNIAVINWRTKLVSILSTEGEVLKQFTNPGFQEPIDITVNSKGEFIISDAGAGKIFIFDTSGNLLTTFGSHGDKDGQFKLISAIAVGKNDEILVADHRIQVFSKDGKFSRRLIDSGKGQFGGICIDGGGHILATKTEKGRSYVQILSGGGKPLYILDSSDDKLKRPSGLGVMSDYRLVIADLGNDCIKKFRYK
ncbi:tripartite motif-containing protein 2-like [Pomacea canaliculata]|nr:tripartite motif-containing protein 2-like [Pomacea canaliculata]XP_025084407.1 tripartite motif-containing protein 2-like [Pomacea canaliculata]XP_025084408.1 tripartite motif-containing protein 2-like [Pomacea canaliculata]XP_025084409.1 tripartite motif-containing protein 2-like [Pomacea canaliculata]XP_025084410.1 tripartite motif-containing protein 2-like [Pomacea canaliculata]XP_025084411.1 tripartite motif-containing protein 2-like [Pomacea canaliculata]XP_025084413.1 tripartite mot